MGLPDEIHGGKRAPQLEHDGKLFEKMYIKHGEKNKFKKKKKQTNLALLLRMNNTELRPLYCLWVHFLQRY